MCSWGILELDSMHTSQLEAFWTRNIRKNWNPTLTQDNFNFLFFSFFELLKEIFFYIKSLQTLLCILSEVLIVTFLSWFSFLIQVSLSSQIASSLVSFPLYSRAPETQNSLSPGTVNAWEAAETTGSSDPFSVFCPGFVFRDFPVYSKLSF